MYEPAYVSSVDYGRKFIIYVSGNMSSEELSVAIDAYGADGTKLLGILNGTEHQNGIKDWWNGVINGTDSAATLAEQINEVLAEDDGQVSPVAISYRLNYLSDNSPVPVCAVQETSENIFLADNVYTVTLSTNDGNTYIDFAPLSHGVFLTPPYICPASKKAVLLVSGDSRYLSGTYQQKEAVGSLSMDLSEWKPEIIYNYDLNSHSYGSADSELHCHITKGIKTD